MKAIGIYKITSPSGKIYIGQSWDIDRRWNEYKTKKAPTQPALRHSFEKYGVDAHAFALVWGFHYTTQEELDGAERLYIRLNKEDGANMLNIKGGGLGGKHSEETKEKMRLTRRGKPKPASYGIKVSQRQLGVPRGVGEDNSKCKLTTAQVLEIRKNFTGFYKYYQETAKVYGVSKESIGNIIRRKTWKHI